MKKPTTVGLFKTVFVAACGMLLGGLDDVRTNESNLKTLVRKVYHFFRSSKIDMPTEDDAQQDLQHHSA